MSAAYDATRRTRQRPIACELHAVFGGRVSLREDRLRYRERNKEQDQRL